MKTVLVVDDPLVHIVGAMNDGAFPNYVSLRTWCGQYHHCEVRELADDRYATCVACVGPPPDWLTVGKALGASTIRWRGSSIPLDLKIL